MKSAWKWILGIVIVLVIVAALVAVPFVMRNFMSVRFASNASRLNNPNTQITPNAPNTPATPGSPNNLPRGRGFYGGPMMRGFGNMQRGYGMPGTMNGFGGGFNRGFGMGRFSPFGFGFMFLGGFLHVIIPLILLALLLWGVYQLGRNSGLRSAQAAKAPAAVNPPAPAPASEQPENTDNNPTV